MANEPEDPATEHTPTEPATEDAHPGLRERWSAVNRLTSQVRLHIGLLAGAAVATGLIEAAFLVSVARVGLAVADGQSRVILTRGVDLTLSQAIIAAGILLVVRLLVAIAGVRVQMGLTYRISTSLRRRLAHAFLRASWGVQQAQPSGTLQQLVVTFPNHASSLIAGLSQATGAGLTLLALVGVALLVDAPATLIVVVVLALLSLLLRPLRRVVSRRSQASIEHQMAFANGVAQVGALGLEIQAFGVRPQAEKHLDGLIGNDAAAQRRVGLISHVVSPIYVTFAYAAVLGALIAVAAIGTGQLQSVGAVMLVMMRSLGYAQQMQQGSVALAQILPFLRAIDDTVDQYEAQPASSGATPVASIGPMEFSGVSFSYLPGTPVLQDLTFRIEPGEVIGIIGPSGGGKSTLVQLLLGLREPDSGQVTVGDVNLREVDRAQWTSKVAFVPQDPLLITGTVAENIRMWRDQITQDQVVAAARAAHVLAEIESLPEGFDADLGERGQKLSGGQRQRISIARALAGGPELLIMDEPTSALDMKAEAAIRETINSLAGKVTVVVIAHRISTLEACDRLMVIQGGRISAFQTPTELQSDSGFYRETLQLAGFR
jgi:ATP-binding cassette, subfamily B, bacterial